MSSEDERKKSVQAAIEKFISKTNAPVINPKPRKPNQRPEKLVERACMAWLKSNKFDVQIVEAKSQLVNGRWQASGVGAGTCDCFGTDPTGWAVFIEFKARGKRASFWRLGNDRQQNYLISKIHLGAFAVVIDDVSDLTRIYREWIGLAFSNRNAARQLLLDHLPAKPQRLVDDSPLFP